MEQIEATNKELLRPIHPKQRGPGQPTKLTDAVADLIAKYVGEGSFFETAAGAAGINRETIRHWVVKGQAAEAEGRNDRYYRFYRKLVLAQNEHEHRLVATLSRGGDGKYSDWRAQEVILSRRYKQRWAEERAPQPAAVTINIGVEAAAALADALAVATAEPTRPLLETSYRSADAAAESPADTIAKPTQPTDTQSVPGS